LKRRYLYLAALLVIGAVTISFLWVTESCFDTPLRLVDDNQELRVDSGSNLTRLISGLADKGVISCPKTILFYAKAAKLDQIQAGEYHISSRETVADLLKKLAAGQVTQYNITFPEGWTFRRWRELMAEQPKIHSTLGKLSDREVIGALGLKVEYPEGWFFPSTYQFTPGDRDVDLLLRAYSKMRETLNREWALREDSLPYKSAYEALVMASIIEKETGVAKERNQIAGVFVRRLQKNMKLQTDPTVIYGLGDRYQGNLTRRHLREDTPYNTYRIYGLPPTPIAMPGEESIHAALHPAEGGSLFFVARGDGSHHFSNTLQEHQKAVRHYQVENRRNNYQTAPQNQDPVYQ